MSLYIDVSNKIKENFSVDWLTDSQKEIFDRCRAFLMPPNRIVNIFGKEGVGKTFIGWVMSKENVGVYVSSIKDLIANQKVLIIDNCDYGRKFVRELRNILRTKRIEHVVLLTRRRVEDDIPAFQLDLTENDIKIFKHNLFFELNIRISEGEGKNLWDCFKQLENIK